MRKNGLRMKVHQTVFDASKRELAKIRKKSLKKPFRLTYEFIVHNAPGSISNSASKMIFSLGKNGALELVSTMSCQIADSKQIKKLGRWLMRAARAMELTQRELENPRKGPRVISLNL